MATAQKSWRVSRGYGISGLNGEVVGEVLNSSEGTFMMRDSGTGLNGSSRRDG